MNIILLFMADVNLSLLACPDFFLELVALQSNIILLLFALISALK